ncbi:MAG: 50S ribosomal protein L4 [Candidatus Bathyarchaeia archaeon]|jgi:large subunit ribosomal protein L4e
MKVPVLSLANEKIDEIELPKVFNTPLNPQVIRRAVIAQQSHDFQPQGRDPLAGKRNTALSRGTGHGQARLPRLKQSGKADFAVQAVGGHLSTPPMSEKITVKRINKKERRLAIRSGIAATANKDVVAARGHKIEGVTQLPLVLDDALEGVQKTREIEDIFTKIGVWVDVERADRKGVRAGRGNMRGRGKKIGKGPLIVISEDKGIGKAARNLPGVDVTLLRNLNAELLAPGANAGRLVVWVKSAFTTIDETWEE